MSYANASVLVTFDASSCEASLNTFENINTYEKRKMPRGIERKIKFNFVSNRSDKSNKQSHFQL